MSREPFVVEVKKDKKWKFWSDHKNYLHAEINRDVKRKGGMQSRIVYQGEVIETESDVKKEVFIDGDAEDDLDVYRESGGSNL